MIYVHVPFCRSFCTYCDFYSEVATRCSKSDEVLKQEALFDDFAEVLAAEATFRAGEITDDVNTLYIGGGTPSVLPLSAFQTLLEALARIRYRRCASGADASVLVNDSGLRFDEFTVEVNPEDIVDKGHSYIEGLLALGVNRISMGVQSFDDSVLKFMNRRHDASTARAAYRILEESGVKNISIDLIFGLPQLSPDQWSDTLSAALDISSRGVLPQHISAYQLSVEPGSMLARLVEKGKWCEASDDLCQQQYSALCEALSIAGYNHYEISNFAQPGFEAVHNSAYWRHIPYVGLGPGAHSFSGSRRQWNQSDLHAYLAAGRRGNFSDVVEGEDLDAGQMALERIMLGLRTSAGLPESFLRTHCDPVVLSRAVADGHLVPAYNIAPAGMVVTTDRQTGANLRIPESHFFISDSIIASLV